MDYDDHSPAAGLDGSSTDIDKLVRQLSTELPLLVTELIQRRNDSALTENDAFARAPDDPHYHDPRWHQFGIVSHLRRAERAYQYEVMDLLAKWGVEQMIAEVMEQEIDHMTRRELLRICLLLHDVGKFTKRRTGTVRGRFRGHEGDSGVIIRGEGTVNNWLKRYGFTKHQIAYIADCAALHYELGKVRNEAIQFPMGYSMAFAKSSTFYKVALSIMRAHPDLAVEIGILFLADNLSKVELRLVDASSDALISSQQSAIESELRTHNLPLSLAAAVLQLPVNIAIAEEYLKIWAKTAYQLPS